MVTQLPVFKFLSQSKLTFKKMNFKHFVVFLKTKLVILRDI